MQILLFTPTPSGPQSAAQAAFFATVDFAELAQQRRWLHQVLDHQAAPDRPGRRLLRLIDSLRTVFEAQGNQVEQRKRYWQAVNESKTWLLQKLAGDPNREGPGNGLLHLLDGIQDFATDTLHVPENIVFPTLRCTLRAERESARLGLAA